MCWTGLLFSDSPVLGQRWVRLPVWLCRPVKPYGKRAHGVSRAAHMACHTPGPCLHPEPAITHSIMCVCEPPLVPFTMGKSDISAVSLLSDARRQHRVNGETVVLCTSEPSILCDSCNSKHWCLFLLDRVTDNECNLLAV